jgi:hypothetical protein
MSTHTHTNTHMCTNIHARTHPPTHTRTQTRLTSIVGRPHMSSSSSLHVKMEMRSGGMSWWNPSLKASICQPSNHQVRNITCTTPQHLKYIILTQDAHRHPPHAKTATAPACVRACVRVPRQDLLLDSTRHLLLCNQLHVLVLVLLRHLQQAQTDSVCARPYARARACSCARRPASNTPPRSSGMAPLRIMHSSSIPRGCGRWA